MKLNEWNSNNKDRLEQMYKGRTIRIEDMNGEPQYTGKTGIVMYVDDIGQLHGTWGGCAIIPGEDEFTVLD